MHFVRVISPLSLNLAYRGGQECWLKLPHREGRTGWLNGARTPRYNCWPGFKWNTCGTKAKMPNNWCGTLAEELSVLHHVGQSHPRSYRKGGEQKSSRERKEGWREWGGKARRGRGFLCLGDIWYPELVWRIWEPQKGTCQNSSWPVSLTAAPTASPLSHWLSHWQCKQQHCDALPGHTPNLPGCSHRKISPTPNFHKHVENVRDGHCLQQNLAQMAAPKPHSRKHYFL